MKTISRLSLLAIFTTMSIPLSAQKAWTLQDCIDYAMTHNISLQKSGLQIMSSNEDLQQSQAALLPSLSVSSNQNVSYRPWPNTFQQTVVNGIVETKVNKAFYNGSYSVGANWTVWNGNRNHNQVKLNEINMERYETDSISAALSLEEQINQLFIQIVYTIDNLEVIRHTLEVSKLNEERGAEMVRIGKMSQADLYQLTAQHAQDEYNLVQAESQVRNYKRQLKQLLEITGEEPFEVSPFQASDAMALAPIPTLSAVYSAAIESRPEIKSAQLAIETSEVQRKIAKAQSLPTVGLNMSAGTNTSSQSDNAWGKQIKTNLSLSGGVNIQVPIFDQRQSRTASNKADLQRHQAELDLREKLTSLYSTIENYWIQAQNSQNQYKAAKMSTESAQKSYDLLSEQFRLGMKNIVELQEGKSRLLTAQQTELQSKYMTILNIKMLELYR